MIVKLAVLVNYIRNGFRNTILPLAPVVFELDFDAVKAASVPSYIEVSKFPVVIRDLAVVVDQGIALQAILDGLKGQLPALVNDIQLFDVYAGKGSLKTRKVLRSG
jgi:phenylalanyl-tRNA synthetase beta chain